MSLHKVMIDSAPLYGGSAVRGMGFYVKNLIEHIQKEKNIKLVDDNFDLIHYPYFDLFVNSLKPPKKTKFVVTVPDLIPLIYPHIYKPGIKGRINLIRQIRALKRADAIITISETSKKDIVRLLGIPKDKVFVTLLGPGNKLEKERNNPVLVLPEKYVLYVGDINWNKNLLNLVKGVNKIGINLVIVGKNAKELLDNPSNFDFANPEIKHLKELRDLLLKSKNIKVMGYLSESDLGTVYSKATIYCQPSFYEGFGLPVLEAMQYGVPIVSSRTQALVEVADDAALYFDPQSVDDIADKISTLFNSKSLRKSLIEKGKERIKHFLWKNTIKDTIKAYMYVTE